MNKIFKIITTKDLFIDVMQRLNMSSNFLDNAIPSLQKSNSFYFGYFYFCSSNNRWNEPTIPMYEEKMGEPIHLKKARLLYQSRKRGMLENDLILSAFASKYLNDMTEQQLELYDRLINLPSNDWEIYYWATGLKPAPPEFDSEILSKLKEFVKNEDRVDRTRQPDF